MSILWWIFAAIAILFEGFFWILPLVGFILQIILIATCVYLIKKVFTKNLGEWKYEIFRTSKNLCIFLGVCISIFLWFLTYHTLFPGYVSDIVISNGVKKVHFLSMSHIATEWFYQDKKSKIEMLNRSWSIFYVEWVAPGSEASHEAFNTALGIDLTNDLYATVARITWLTLQVNDNLLTWVDADRIRNVDMNMDEIALSLSGSTPTLSWSTAIDMTEVLDTFDIMTNQEKIFARFVLRAFFNWSLKNTDTLEASLMWSNSPLFDIILTERNKRVIDTITASWEKESVLIYWALHFPWILNWLKEVDPKWSIESFESVAPYSAE
jgi:hypothetical protein